MNVLPNFHKSTAQVGIESVHLMSGISNCVHLLSFVVVAWLIGSGSVLSSDSTEIGHIGWEERPQNDL